MDGLHATRHFTRRAAGIAIAVVVASAVLLCKVYVDQVREAWWQQSRADVAERLNLVAAGLQGRIDSGVQLVRGLVAVVSADPQIDADHFNRIGTELLSGQPEARMIAAAPSDIVSMVFPAEDNEAAFGYRLAPPMTDGESRTAGGHRIDLIGPFESPLGGKVLSAHAPVFLGPDRTRWGSVLLVIDAPALFRTAGLEDPSLGLDMAIDTPGGVVLGSPGLFTDDPVVMGVKVPGGEWRLGATPTGGWPAPPGLWAKRALFLLLGLVLIAAILAAARVAEARQRQLALIRQREAELSQLSWRLEFALASSNIGVWHVDLATDELYWDARAKALFGREDDGLHHHGFDDWISVVHPDDRARAVAEADLAANDSGRFFTRYRIILPGGEVRHIQDVARVHAGEDGSRRLVGLIWDVTREVERQEELELKRVEAEAATTAKSRFLASMSHEIRTPMSGVLGVLGLMLDDPLPPEQRERAQIALASAENLLGILNDILDFSKLEAAEVVLGEEAVDIRALVAGVADLMSPNAIRKGLSVSHKVSAAVPRFVLADPVRLRQIVTNFLSNATKFTERGEIMLRVDYAGGTGGGTLSIEVEDTGIGVSPENQEAIFQRFIQADDSLARRAGGTGLGLAISSQLAELMGGRVSLRSVVGMGSTFRVEIPSRPAQPAGVLDEVRPDRGRETPLRVLLAEDHATNQYVISAYLRDAGHHVTLVENGVEAVRAVRGGGFDLVLMDVQMPVMDGLTAAAAIRALDGPAAAVPILALTASAMPGDREACLGAGMDGHLSKPITAASLRAALRAVAAARVGDADEEALRTGTSA